MFKKPFYITLSISGIGFTFSFILLLAFSTESPWKLFFTSFFLFGGLFLISQLIFDKFIYNRMKILFDKVLHITYEQRVFKLLEDPFALIDERVDNYILEKEAAKKALLTQQRFRREYIGNIAHELKTPIFTIQGYVATLLDGGLEDPRINRDYLERTDRNIERLNELLDDLDLITRLDSGEFPLAIETFDIVKVCQEVMQSLELKAQENEISLAFASEFKRQIFVDADKARIYQVVSNLVVNAIKYNKEGGEVRINFNEMSEDYLLVEVIDKGLGISRESLLRVFERFYRVEKSRGRAQGGSGLGLSIVKHIIEAHDQSVNVTSEIGKGSTFSFTLKLS